MSAQPLYDLDRTSAGFPEQLDGLLRNGEWVEQLKLLPKHELRDLVVCLDSVSAFHASTQSRLSPLQILDDLDRTGPQFRKCLHILQATCFSGTILPSTHEVPGELSCITGQPATLGGFSDIYKGSLNGEAVCIKLLREHTEGNRAAVGQVIHPQVFPWTVKP